MITKDKLEDALSLVIPHGLVRDMNNSDLNKLMASYAVMEQARDDMLNRLITVDEYCDLCQTHEVNVDSYMATVESNLYLIGIS